MFGAGPGIMTALCTAFLWRQVYKLAEVGGREGAVGLLYTSAALSCIKHAGLGRIFRYPVKAGLWIAAGK